MHGIISLHDNPVGAGFTPAQNDSPPYTNDAPPHTNDGQRDINVGQREIDDGQRDINVGKRHINVGKRHINNGQPPTNDGQPQGIAHPVSDIVGAYKSLVANGCLALFKSKNKKMGKLWQRNYYEHIIHNEK